MWRVSSQHTTSASCNAAAARGGGDGRRGAGRPFTAEGEKTIRAALELLKPYLRA